MCNKKLDIRLEYVNETKVLQNIWTQKLHPQENFDFDFVL